MVSHSSDRFSIVVVKILKSTKNNKEQGIETITILGFLMADTLSKQ